MARIRVLKSVLHNFLGTYTSRYTDYGGYWLFGFFVQETADLSFDLLAWETDPYFDCREIAHGVAINKFADQLRKAGIPVLRVRSANLEIKRLPQPIAASVNGHNRQGYLVHFQATATIETGQAFSAECTRFIAPHDPALERQSSRVDGLNEDATLPNRRLTTPRLSPSADNSGNVLNGAILGPVQGLHFRVALDDGQEILAVLKKATIKRYGCLLGDLAGWRVTVARRDGEKPPVIVELQPPPAEES